MASPTEDCRNVIVTGTNVFPPPGDPVRCSRYAMAVLCIGGLSLYILYLFDGPSVPEFRIDSAIFTPVNATDSELTADWDVAFRVQNRNHKFSISYEKLEVAVQYGRDFTIGIVQLPRFSQPKKNTTIVRARLRVVGAYVGDGVASEISRKVANGSLAFGVNVVCRTRFKPRLWMLSIEKAFLRMRCKSVEFMVSGNPRASTPRDPWAMCEYVYYRHGRRIVYSFSSDCCRH